MKKAIRSSAAFLLIVSLTIFSCKKKEDDPAPATTPVVVTSSFTWQENSGSVITADSAFWTTGSWGTGIRAYKGGMANFFELNWATQNNTSVGAKTMEMANYGFTFLKGSDTYNITADENINITASANNIISGNFNVDVTGGSITNITATFKALPKK